MIECVQILCGEVHPPRERAHLATIDNKLGPGIRRLLKTYEGRKRVRLIEIGTLKKLEITKKTYNQLKPKVDGAPDWGVILRILKRKLNQYKKHNIKHPKREIERAIKAIEEREQTCDTG